MQPIVPFMVPGSHIFWGPEWFGSFWCCMSCGGSEQHGGGTKGLCCALLGSARRGSDRACAECLVQPSGSRCLGKFGSESHPINLCRSWCWFRRACLVKMAQTWWSMMINDDQWWSMMIMMAVRKLQKDKKNLGDRPRLVPALMWRAV